MVKTFGAEGLDGDDDPPPQEDAPRPATMAAAAASTRMYSAPDSPRIASGRARAIPGEISEEVAISARRRLPRAKRLTEPVVHTSGFSVLRSCSRSLLGSGFGVQGSSFWLARFATYRAIPTIAETIMTNSGKNSKRRMLREYRDPELRTTNIEPCTEPEHEQRTENPEV
jgi:hypothetical protein